MTIFGGFWKDWRGSGSRLFQGKSWNIQCSLCFRRGLNHIPPEWKSEALPLESTCS